MSKILLLAKILRKSGAGSDETFHEHSADLAKNIIFALLGIAGVALTFWIGTLLGGLSKIADFLAYDIFQVLFMTGAFIGLFFAIPPIVNSFYMSGDIPVVLMMPLSSIQIVVARIINAASFPLAITFISTIPAGIGFMVTTQVTPNFVIAILLAFVCNFLISISAIATVIVLLMTFVKILRNKDLLKIIGVIIVFAVLVLYYVVLGVGNDEKPMSEVAISVANSMVPYSNALPINFALRELMTQFSWVAVLEIVGITAAFVILFLLVAKVLYLSGAIDMQSTASVNRQLSESDMKKKLGKRGQIAAMVQRDLRMVRRNPAYLMTGYLYTFGMPILMFFAMAMSRMKDLAEFFSDPANISPVFGYALVVGIGIIIPSMTTCMNAIASTAISREGASFGILKQFPMSWEDILKAKQRAAFIICESASLLYVLVAEIVALVLGVIDIPQMLLGLLVQGAMSYLCVNINIMHDIKVPNLTWESEAQMVKKSSNCVTSIIIFVCGIFVPLLLWMVADVRDFLGMMIAFGLALLVIVASIAFHFYMNKVGVRRLKKM